MREAEVVYLDGLVVSLEDVNGHVLERLGQDTTWAGHLDEARFDLDGNYKGEAR